MSQSKKPGGFCLLPAELTAQLRGRRAGYDVSPRLPTFQPGGTKQQQPAAAAAAAYH